MPLPRLQFNGIFHILNRRETPIPPRRARVADAGRPPRLSSPQVPKADGCAPATAHALAWIRWRHRAGRARCRAAWDGLFERLDLYRRTLHTMPAGNHWAKAVFCSKRSRRRGGCGPTLFWLYTSDFCRLAAVASTLIRADLALIAIGQAVWAPMRALGGQ